MIVKLILVFAVILGVLVGAHLLLYLSLARLFAITHGGTRTALLVLLLLGALSFPAAALLAHFWESTFSKVSYLLAATWLGLFIYLLLAVTASWLLVLLLRLLGVAPPLRVIASVACAAAVLATGYGVWQALHPRLRRLEVRVAGLPPGWAGKTLVQLSDVHLGYLHGPRFLQRIVAQVRAVQPDLLLVTGDLFDGMGGKLPALVGGLNQLEAKRGSFFVLGNHEVYLGPVRVREILARTHLRELDCSVVSLDGLQLVGVPYPGVDSAACYERLRQQLAPDQPSILLFHTPTNIERRGPRAHTQHASTYWTPDTSFAAAKALGVDLQLSGHTHAGQFFPFELLTRRIYRRFDYGLHTEGAFQLYTTSGTGTWGPPLRVLTPAEIVVIELQPAAS